MKSELAASFAAAILLHALVLFAFRMETAPRPPAMSDEQNAPMEVSLVEAPPEAAPPAAAPTPPEPAPIPDPAEPQPTPETPTPPPDMSTSPPAPTLEQESIPAPDSTPAAQRPKTAPRRPQPRRTTPHSASGAAAALAGAASHGTTVGALSSHARYLGSPRADYPEAARPQRQQGVVEVNVLVGADGRASEASVSRSSGFPLLDAAAVDAVRRWTFEPARAGGVPVSDRVTIPVRFSLAN